MPYLIASLTVPIFGTILRNYPDFVYEKGIFSSLILILITHLSYILIQGPTNIEWLPILPIIIFGLGHASFTTIAAPTVPKLVNQELLPVCFSILKVAEGASITLVT